MATQILYFFFSPRTLRKTNPFWLIFGVGSNHQLVKMKEYLEDHPRTCKWLLSMVINFLTRWDDPPSTPFFTASFGGLPNWPLPAGRSLWWSPTARSPATGGEGSRFLRGNFGWQGLLKYQNIHIDIAYTAPDSMILHRFRYFHNLKAEEQR